MQSKVVTIDGVAGCGKSTAAVGVARAIGGVSFGSGVVYRAVTHLALANGCDLRSSSSLLGLLDQHRIELRADDGEIRVRVDGELVGVELHGSEVTRQVHWVANSGEVREALLPLQRAIVSDVPIVAEGRDMGTVVFPEADLRVYLTASVEERARRRQAELHREHGERIDASRVAADLQRRDDHDRNRAHAPLRVPEGALVIDTSALTPEDVVERILSAIPDGRR